MKKKQTQKTLKMINPNVCGIDIGNDVHYVAVPAHLSEESVRKFGTFTADLEALGDWLISLGIESVAMESTGIYWLGIFEVLECKGLEVYLVNAPLMARDCFNE